MAGDPVAPGVVAMKHEIIARLAVPARRRAWQVVVARTVAPAAALALAAWWAGGVLLAVCVSAFVGGVIAATAMREAGRLDESWLVATLDRAHPELEDSTDLVFADPAGLSPLQWLQAGRIATRVERLSSRPLLEPWPTRDMVIGAIIVIAVAGAVLAWPDQRAPVLAPADEGLSASPGVPRLVGQQLMVEPPGYTGAPTRSLDTLDARVPEGSRLVWTLRFAPQPSNASLVKHDGAHIVLRLREGMWRASHRVTQSLLYRVRPEGGRGVPPLHRIEMIADRPPEVRMVTPRETLNTATAGQRIWRVMFEAVDDYGVVPAATLRLILAQGEGENVTFRERSLTVRGVGDRRRMRFGAGIDLGAIGFSEPGDLIAQLTVRDAEGHRVQGPGVILRRPPPRPADSGLEAMTRQALPAYFRSQRQVIIDAEALIASRPRLAADRFLSRSDAIGDDQRLLRMRYGQFMGEESGGGATAAMPTNDAEETSHEAEAGHEHQEAASSVFGALGDITAEVGHTHDEPEAATLLDPETRATLRQALDAMWQSESALRVGEPKRALPHAYRALRFIKQVQQATRIFLARTGPQLPPVDESRRLTGKREGIAGRPLPDLAGRTLDPAAGAAWRALENGKQVDLSALQRWAAANASRIADPLALAAAIDAVRVEPGCAACRARLRAQLWGVMARPAAGVVRRTREGAMGQRYLEALR